jgi:hypothetical protein
MPRHVEAADDERRMIARWAKAFGKGRLPVNRPGGDQAILEGGGCADRPLVSLTVTSSFLLASTQKMHPLS